MKKKTKNNKVILLVDDNPDLLYSVEKGLESISKDFEVVTVESGRKCIQSLKKIKPDLILLDIMMPGMDGWDTCAKIKSNKKTENIPIVFLTAKTDPVSKIWAESKGPGKGTTISFNIPMTQKKVKLYEKQT